MDSPSRRKALISLGTSPIWVKPVVSAVVLPAHAQTSPADDDDEATEYFRADIPASFALIHVLLAVTGDSYTVEVSDRDGSGNGFTFAGAGTVGGGEIMLTNTSSGSLDCIDLDAFITVMSADAIEAIADYRNTFGPSFSGETIPVGSGSVVPATCAGSDSLKRSPGPRYPIDD